jgi:exonuclease VII large subunit
MKFSHLLQLLILLVFASSFSCSPNQNAQNWVRKTERQWSSWEKKQPQWLETLDTSSLQEQLTFLTTAQQTAQKWLGKPIDTAIKINIENLHARLTLAKNRLERQQIDPSVYNLGLRLQTLYSNKTTLEKTDLEKLAAELDQAGRYYDLARTKLKKPIAVRCDSAVHQHIAGITFLLSQFKPKLEKLQVSQEKISILQKIDRTCFFMKDYLAWCRSMAFEMRDSARQ